MAAKPNRMENVARPVKPVKPNRCRKMVFVFELESTIVKENEMVAHQILNVLTWCMLAVFVVALLWQNCELNSLWRAALV